VYGDIFSLLLAISLSLTQHCSGLIILLLVVEVEEEILTLLFLVAVEEVVPVVLYLLYTHLQQHHLQSHKHILGTLDILCKLENNILLVLGLTLLVLELAAMHLLLEITLQ
jgi:hypothetical protein